MAAAKTLDVGGSRVRGGAVGFQGSGQGVKIAVARNGGSTVMALDFNQGFRNLIEDVQSVQGTVGGGPPQCDAGARPPRQSLSPFGSDEDALKQNRNTPLLEGAPRFWMRYLLSLSPQSQHVSFMVTFDQLSRA